jgi:hypothetical protein
MRPTELPQCKSLTTTSSSGRGDLGRAIHGERDVKREGGGNWSQFVTSSKKLDVREITRYENADHQIIFTIDENKR